MLKVRDVEVVSAHRIDGGSNKYKPGAVIA